jgi:hypothetical protein
MNEDENLPVFVDFDANDYIIRLSPFLDERGDWTGELLVGSVTTGENTMSDEDHYSLMKLSQLVCAAVPALEEHESVRTILSNIAEDTLQDEAEKEKVEPKVKEVTENVIRVNF